LRRFWGGSKRYGTLAAVLLQVAFVALLMGATPHSIAATGPSVSEGRQVAGEAGRLSEVLALSHVPPTITAIPTSRPLPSPTPTTQAAPTQSPPARPLAPTPLPYAAPISAPVRSAQAAPPTPTPLPPAPLPPTSLPPTQPPPSQASAAQGCNQIIDLINQIRSQNGLPALVYHPQLEADAQAYADFLAAHNAMSHTADGRTLDARAEAAGYTTWTALGENLAAGYATFTDAVNAWMASPGHRANILNPVFTETGVGCAWNANTSYGWFYVQEFGTR
jgi:uncharacterized protein YkwD